MNYWRIINTSNGIVKVPVNVAHNQNVVVLLEVDQCVIGLPQPVQQALVQEKRGFVKIERGFEAENVELGVPIKYEKPIEPVIPPVSEDSYSIREDRKPIFDESAVPVLDVLSNESEGAKFWRVTNVSEQMIKMGVSIASDRCPGLILKPQESVLCLPNMTTTMMHQKTKGNIEINDSYFSEDEMPLGIIFELKEDMTIGELRELIKQKEVKQ